MDIFNQIWNRTAIRELVLFVVTATAVVLVAQLQALDDLFAEGATLDDLKTWAAAAASAVGVTAIRQTIAYGIAKLAGSSL